MPDSRNDLSTSVTIEVVAPHTADATAVLRAYIDDVASRYYERPATDAEIEAALLEHPSGDLVPPTGLFLLAREADQVLGCVGMVQVSADVGEVRRLFVTHAARGRGVGALLMGEVERRARDQGLELLRLDTRADLVEARRLYASLGYDEVPAFCGGPYSDHWFAKSL